MSTEKSTPPSPDSRTILMDIDGTLIDESYLFTDDKIHAAVHNLQDKGWDIGLSSDSPRHLMQRMHQELGLNGSIIAEKGAVVEHGGAVKYEEGLREFFSRLKAEAEDKLRSDFPNYLWWEGDPVEAIRTGNIPGSPGDTIILQNAYRECSYGIFMRHITANGKALIVPELTEEIVGHIRPLYEGSDSDEDMNHEYGLLIVSAAEVAKRLGTTSLMRELELADVGMVGNSMTDFVGSDIAVHYAVANATREFRDVADYTSDRSYTSGVVDILTGLSAEEA